jgi:hypothetical protein
MPVILVAQEFPRPDEIDEDWIIANDWILRRVILDDSFLPALNSHPRLSVTNTPSKRCITIFCNRDLLLPR